MNRDTQDQFLQILSRFATKRGCHVAIDYLDDEERAGALCVSTTPEAPALVVEFDFEDRDVYLRFADGETPICDTVDAFVAEYRRRLPQPM